VTKRRCVTDKKQAQARRYHRQLEMIDPDAAFIDVGSAEHWVCIPENRFSEQEQDKRVRQFEAFTSQLYEIRAWLLEHQIKTVSMESTGVYWIPLYQILADAGLEVSLVNARDLKSVKGRPKTDRLDCQWGQRLHSYGLLRASFRPAAEICAMRSIWRTREQWVREMSRCTQRMHKALHEMNLLLPKVVSDITGKTGMSIIKAILAGERDPVKLAQCRDPRCRSSKERIAEALRGDYRPELLFVLGAELEHYEFLLHKLEEFDRQISQRLAQLPNKTQLSATQKAHNAKEHAKLKRRYVKAPCFDSRSVVHELSGVDFGAVPGIGSTVALAVILEVGLDSSKWPSADHFAAWLGLCPNPRRSAGRDLGTHTKKCANRAAQQFRKAASTLRRNHSYLGDFYRRMRARHGEAHAITATAHKLAVLFYTLLSRGDQFVELDRSEYQRMVQQTRVSNLLKRARKLGFELKPVHPQAEQTLASIDTVRNTA